MSECMLKMCALLYYLCLTYALFHFFFPFNRTPTPVLYSFSNWESRGIVLCFPEPSVAVLGPIFWPIQLWGGGLPKPFEVCHQSPPERKLSLLPCYQTFGELVKSTIVVNLIFIIANPTDKFYGCLPEKY